MCGIARKTVVFRIGRSALSESSKLDVSAASAVGDQ